MASITVGNTQANVDTSLTVSPVLGKPTSLAVSDLMIAGLNYSDGSIGAVVTPPAGWTQLRGGAVGIGGFYTFWKFATSGDVAASNFTFSLDRSSKGVNFCTRFSGNIDTTVPFGFNHDTSGSSTTPSDAGTAGNGLQPLLVMIIASLGTVAVRSVSGYQVANTNPTWTESTDNGVSGPFAALAMATAPYTLTTASGAAQATISGAVNANCLQILAINTTITRVTILSIASAVINPAVVKKFAVTVLSAALALISPTASTILKKWSNTSKDASSWSNPSKSSPSSPTNTSKHSTTWTNPPKS